MSISFKAQSEKLDSLLKDTRIKVLSHNEMKTLSATAKTCVEFSEDLDTITSFITKTLIDNKLKASSWAHEWDQFDTKINDSTDEVIRVEPSIDEYVYSEIDVFLNTIGIKVDCQLTYNHDNAQAINSDIACLTRLESQLEAVFSNPSIHSKRTIASNHTMTRDAIKAQAKIFYDMIQGHIAYLAGSNAL